MVRHASLFSQLVALFNVALFNAHPIETVLPYSGLKNEVDSNRLFIQHGIADED